MPLPEFVLKAAIYSIQTKLNNENDKNLYTKSYIDYNTLKSQIKEDVADYGV